MLHRRRPPPPPQQPQPQIRMSLKHSSATAVKRTRCYCCSLCLCLCLCGCARRRQISTTLRWTADEWATSAFRLLSSWSSSSVLLLSLDVWQFFCIDRSIQPGTSHNMSNMSKTKPVWPINTSITTQLFLPPVEHDLSGWSWAMLLVKFLIYLSFN